MKILYRFIVVLFLLTTFLNLTSCVDKGGGIHITPQSLTYLEEQIVDGDNKFKRGDYQDAINIYYKVEKDIKNNTTYENNSEIKNSMLIQRYKNLSETLQARIWITINILDARSLPS